MARRIPWCLSSTGARWARWRESSGAGGNVGAVLAGFLFKTASITWPQALLILGVIVAVISSLTLVVRFSEADERRSREEIEARLGRAGSRRGRGGRLNDENHPVHLLAPHRRDRMGGLEPAANSDGPPICHPAAASASSPAAPAPAAGATDSIKLGDITFRARSARDCMSGTGSSPRRDRISTNTPATFCAWVSREKRVGIRLECGICRAFSPGSSHRRDRRGPARGPGARVRTIMRRTAITRTRRRFSPSSSTSASSGWAVARAEPADRPLHVPGRQRDRAEGRDAGHLKRDRVSQRLLGDFGWSDVGRSFDGLHYSLSGASDDFTFVSATPTRGVFQADGWGWNKVGFALCGLHSRMGQGPPFRRHSPLRSGVRRLPALSSRPTTGPLRCAKPTRRTS